MADEADMADAVSCIRQQHDQFVIMHCTSEYPTPYEDVNLLAMQTLREKFNALTGLSDHTVGIMTATVAVGMGACAVEKHLTLARYMKGTDHACSLEPDGLRRVVRDIRNLERALGTGKLEPPPGVQEAVKKLRRSLVTKVEIPQGTILTEDMLTMKSPGTGLKWRDRNQIVGKRAVRDLPPNITLSPADFS
jgi:sialic acid synthase SpsE